MNDAPKTYWFNFHNLVAFQLITSDQLAIDFYVKEFQHHQTSQPGPDLPLVVLRYRYHPFPGFTQPKKHGVFHAHKVAARWRYQMQFDENAIHIDTVGNHVSIAMIHHMLIHHSIRYLAVRANVLMLHAAGLADQGKSIILSAIGGTGKTTTVSMAMAYGSRCWALHADDYVFISPEKKRSYGYITRSHLYRSLLHWVPEISQTLTRWERVQLLIHDFILKLSNKHIRLPVRIELARIWERNGVCYEAEPIIIAKLLKGGVVKNQQANSTTDFADFLLNMNFEEARHYMTLIQKCGITGEHPELISRWIEDEKRLISQLLSVIPAAEVTLPKVGQKSKNMGKLINTLLDEMIDEQEAKKQP